jgi:hypothetical protein
MTLGASQQTEYSDICLLHHLGGFQPAHNLRGFFFARGLMATMRILICTQGSPDPHPASARPNRTIADCFSTTLKPVAPRRRKTTPHGANVATHQTRIYSLSM